jgi:hypothetical protein
MAEEKEEKKKPGIVRRIFKWFGLGLLTVLIIFGLIFQAPWKVTTLLVIILAACTVLPKPARKWFWLTVGVVVIVLIIWVFLPEDNEGWRPYTFDEELAALQAKYAVLDEENAAIIYNRLLEQEQQEDQNEPNIPEDYYQLDRFEPWSSEDHLIVAQWLEGQQTKIETLLEASKVERCAFPLNVNIINFGERMDRLAAMRRWAYLLLCSANNDIAEGRSNKALEKYLAVLQMGKHQWQQPVLVDTLVGTALEALAFRQFTRFTVTGNATEEHLSVIEEALTEIKHDWSSDLPRILEGEKLLFKNALGMFYEVNPEGRTRLNRGSGLSFCGRLKCELPKRKAKRNYWRRKLTKAGTILGWFFLPASPQKASEIIDAGYERLYAMAEPDFDWQKGTEKPTKMFHPNYQYLVEHSTEILAPAYHRIHDLYLRLTADKRGSRIIIALRRYKNKDGTWPQTLDEIEPLAPVEVFVDPHNNGQFVYKLTDDSFKLYSKGKNNIDDGGGRERNIGTSCAPNLVDERRDDWLIWPPKSRKAKKEGTNAEQQ